MKIAILLEMIKFLSQKWVKYIELVSKVSSRFLFTSFVPLSLSAFFFSLFITFQSAFWLFYNALIVDGTMLDFLSLLNWFVFNIIRGNYFLNYFGAEGVVFNIVRSSSGLFPEIISFWFTRPDNKDWGLTTAWYSLTALSGPVLLFVSLYCLDTFFIQPYVWYWQGYIDFIEEDGLWYLPPAYDDEEEKFHAELWWQYFHVVVAFAMASSVLAFVHIDGYYGLLEFRYDYSTTLITNAWDVHVDTKAVSRLRLDKYREAYDTYSKLLLTQAQNHVFLQTFLDVLQIRYGPTAGQYFYLTPHTSLSAEPFYLSRYSPASLDDLHLNLSTVKEVFSSFDNFIKPDRNTFSALNHFGATFEKGYVESRWIWNDFLFFVENLAELKTAKPVRSITGEDVLKWPDSFSVSRSRFSEIIGDNIPHYQLPATSYNPYNYLFYAYKPHYAATLDFLEKLLFKGVSLDYFSILQNYMRPRIDKVHEYSSDFFRMLTGIHAKASHPGMQRRMYHHYATGDIERDVKLHSPKRAVPTSYVIEDKKMERWDKKQNRWESRLRKVPLEYGETAPEFAKWKYLPKYFTSPALFNNKDKPQLYNFYTTDFFKPNYHNDHAYFISRVRAVPQVSKFAILASRKPAYAPFVEHLKAERIPTLGRKLKKFIVLDLKKAQLEKKVSHYVKIYHFLDLFNYNKKIFDSIVPCDFVKKNPSIKLLWKARVLPNHANVLNALSLYNLKFYPFDSLSSGDVLSGAFVEKTIKKPFAFDYTTFYSRASNAAFTEIAKGASSTKKVFWASLKFIKPYYKLSKVSVHDWVSTYRNPAGIYLSYLRHYLRDNPFFSRTALHVAYLVGDSNLSAVENSIDGTDGGVSAWEPMWITGSKIKTPLAFAQHRIVGSHVQVLYNQNSIRHAQVPYAHEFRNYFYRWLTWLTHRPYTALGDQGYLQYPARKTRVSWQMPIYRRYRRFSSELDFTSYHFLNANRGRLMRPYSITWSDTWRRGIIWDVPNHIQVGALHFAWPFAFDRAGLVPVEWFYSRFTRNDFALNYSLIEWWSPDLRLTRIPSYASIWHHDLPDYITKKDCLVPQFSRYHLFTKKLDIEAYTLIVRNKILQRNALIQQLASWRLGTAYQFYGVSTGLSFDKHAPYSELLGVFAQPPAVAESPITLLNRFNPFSIIPRFAYPIKFFDWLLGTPEDTHQNEFLKIERSISDEFQIAGPEWKTAFKKGRRLKIGKIFKGDELVWKAKLETFPKFSKRTLCYLKTGEFNLVKSRTRPKADPWADKTSSPNSPFKLVTKKPDTNSTRDFSLDKFNKLSATKPVTAVKKKLDPVAQQKLDEINLKRQVRYLRKAKLWYSTFTEHTYPHFMKSLPSDQLTLSESKVFFKRLFKLAKVSWKAPPDLPAFPDEADISKQKAVRDLFLNWAKGRLYKLKQESGSLNESSLKTVHSLLSLLSKTPKTFTEPVKQFSQSVSVFLSQTFTRWPLQLVQASALPSEYQLPGSLPKLVSNHFFYDSMQTRLLSLVKPSYLDRLSYFKSYEGPVLSSLAVRAYKPVPTYMEFMFALFDDKYKPSASGTFLAYHQKPSKYGLMNAVLRKFYNAQARPVYFYSFKVMSAVNVSPYRAVAMSSTPLHFLSDGFNSVYKRYLEFFDGVSYFFKAGFCFSFIYFFAPALAEDFSKLSFELINDDILRVSLVEEFWSCDINVGWLQLNPYGLYLLTMIYLVEWFISFFILIPLFSYIVVLLMADCFSSDVWKLYFEKHLRYSVVAYQNAFWGIVYSYKYIYIILLCLWLIWRILVLFFWGSVHLYLVLEEEAWLREEAEFIKTHKESHFKARKE